MYLSPPRKKLLGTATAIAVLVPLIFVPLGVAAMLFFVFGPGLFDSSGAHNPDFVFALMPRFFLLLFPLLGCASVAQIVLQVIYLVLVIGDGRLSDLARVLFVMGIFFFPTLGMPVYFFAYLWSDTPPGMAKQLLTAT